nr:terminase [Alphaproteobacteria bacterium]
GSVRSSDRSRRGSRRPGRSAPWRRASACGRRSPCGGGKSDLLLGTALTRHHKAIVFRKQKLDAKALIDRADAILGDFGHWSGPNRCYATRDGRELEFGHCSRPGDEQSHQGRARDFYGFDELAHFTEAEYVFITGWLRSTDPNQRCRIIGASNPPLTAEGAWLIRRWAPWLDRNHPNPALPGELRWFATIDGKDTEVAGPEPFDHTGKDGKTERIEPRSRTFIPAKLEDNPYYARSGYRSVLQAMPEPQRSALLEGRFDAAMLDDAWQVIPTAWIEAAMARWVDRKPGPMDTAGVDPARGGAANMVIAPRHGDWFAPLVSIEGREVPTGVAAAGHVIRHLRDGAVVQVDVIGVGASCYDQLDEMNVTCAPMIASAKSHAKDRSGALGFVNRRAEWWWGMREALDPETGDDLALPPDSELKADLTAPTWQPTLQGIKVEAKEDIEDRLGRSVDKGDAVVMALPQEKPKASVARQQRRPTKQNSGYSPHRWRQ